MKPLLVAALFMLAVIDRRAGARWRSKSNLFGSCPGSSLALAVAQRQPRLAQVDALAGDIERRRVAGDKSTFKKGDDLRLSRLPPLHERPSPLCCPEAQEGRPHATAKLPCSHCHILARAFDKIARPFNPLLAFTGNFQDKVHDEPDRPSRGVDDSRVLSGLKAARRLEVWRAVLTPVFASATHASLDHTSHLGPVALVNKSISRSLRPSPTPPQ